MIATLRRMIGRDEILASLAAALVALLVLSSGLVAAGAAQAEQPRPCFGCGPPTVICGQTLFPPVGPGDPAEAFTRPGRFRLSRAMRVEADDRPPILQLVTSCDAGVEVSIRPRGVVTIVKRAVTQDRRTAAIVLQPQRGGRARIIVTRRDGQRTIIAVQVRAK